MSRLMRFWRAQRRAWSMLFAPAPKPIAWPEPSESSHPWMLCRCSGVPIDQGTIAHADHRPDCPWLAAMCRTCCGTGWCQSCGGDGTRTEGP